MNWPDRLAYLRIILAPVVMVIVMLEDDLAHSYGIAAVLFTIAAASDWFDGFLARRWQITTILGAFLDSVADKLLVTAALVALVETGRVWAWAAFVIVGRELVVMGLRGVAAMEHAALPPSIWGKIKATVQFVALGFAMLRFPDPWGPFHFDQWLMLAAVGVTLMSAVEYFRRFGTVLRRDRAPL
jgi:CDP-diacylglycerol---glycerol-3-phosphate 3-phosphatidyltransferase